MVSRGAGLSGGGADAGTYVASGEVRNIVTLTQAEYDALTPDPNTLYVITD